MSIEISYTQARDHLASYMDRAVADHEVITIRRKVSDGTTQEVALIDADDLNSLLETIHLLSSPKNAERIFSALESAKAKTVAPSTIEDLERRYGLSPNEPVEISDIAEENETDASDKSNLAAHL